MIVVDIAQFDVTRGDVLITYALGSCVGVCLYDEIRGIGGMAHIMLPDSSVAYTELTPSERRRYADTSVPDLVDALCRAGAGRFDLCAVMAGGAQMFGVASAAFNIGQRNADAVEKALSACRIPIVARDTGGNFARTLWFDTASGRVEVRSARRGTSVLKSP